MNKFLWENLCSSPFKLTSHFGETLWKYSR